MRNTLLDNSRGKVVLATNLPSILRLDDLEFAAILGQRVGVYGCLRDKSIGQRYTDDACNKASASEKEEVPMEAARFLQREIPSLSSYTALVLGESKPIICFSWRRKNVRDRSRREASTETR